MNELEPGQPVRIAPDVQRVVAPNASVFTGPGTNTYVLGEPAVAIIDPGPDDPRHLEVLRGLAPGLTQVFVTHTHRDHSPGARALAVATGARLIGLPAPCDGRQDDSFIPDLSPANDDCFAIGTASLRAIHTPGHASNHVCYLLAGANLLFSGDHILDGMTPVILAPDGDMSAYLEALARLKSYPIDAIAPGHGRVLAEPLRVIDALIAHRRRRESKVVAVLGELRRASTDQLLPRVYSDVHPKLLPIARFSLEAHLIKLARDGYCSGDSGSWTVNGSPSG